MNKPIKSKTNIPIKKENIPIRIRRIFHLGRIRKICNPMRIKKVFQ